MKLVVRFMYYTVRLCDIPDSSFCSFDCFDPVSLLQCRLPFKTVQLTLVFRQIMSLPLGRLYVSVIVSDAKSGFDRVFC